MSFLKNINDFSKQVVSESSSQAMILIAVACAVLVLKLVSFSAPVAIILEIFTILMMFAVLLIVLSYTVMTITSLMALLGESLTSKSLIDQEKNLSLSVDKQPVLSEEFPTLEKGELEDNDEYGKSTEEVFYLKL